MRKKKIWLFIVMIIAASMTSCASSDTENYSSHDLKLSGTLWENLSDFNMEISENQLDSLTEAYLEAVNYEVIELDMEAKKATLEISAPQISELLLEIIDNAVAANDDIEYAELKNIVEDELISAMGSETLEKETSEIKLSVEQVDDTYKFAPNEDWDQLINEKLDNLASFDKLLNNEWAEKQQSNSLETLLTSNYWWNDIQDYNVYKFEKDGTWYTVESRVSDSANPLPIEVLGEKEDIGSEGTYTINGNQIIMIRDDGYENVLDYMTKQDSAKYDVTEPDELNSVINTIDIYNYEGGFLFETDFSLEEEPWGEATYLLPYDDLKESLGNSSLSEDQLKKVKESLSIPDDLDTEITQSQAFWDDSTQRWLIDVSFYHNGELAAGACVDMKTAELVRNIRNYSDGAYLNN